MNNSLWRRQRDAEQEDGSLLGGGWRRDKVIPK